jgi:phospholipase/lecithinase/hemolysin
MIREVAILWLAATAAVGGLELGAAGQAQIGSGLPGGDVVPPSVEPPSVEPFAVWRRGAVERFGIRWLHSVERFGIFRPRVPFGIAPPGAGGLAAAPRWAVGRIPGGVRFSLTDPPSALFVLGDSLSDVGNAAALPDYLLGRSFYPEATIGLCNPSDIYLFDRSCDDLIYMRSRVSNGPVAVEVLAAALGLSPLEPSFHVVPRRPVHGTNYAVAGATAAGTGIDDLASQVDVLRLDRGPVLPGDALYVLLIGGNDALAALRDAAEAEVGLEPAQDSTEAVTAAVGAIGDAVDALVDSGARQVMVANLPNLAVLPVLRERAEAVGLATATAEALAAGLTATFNAALSERLQMVQQAHPEARIEPFDLYAAVDQVRLVAETVGINVTDACFDSEAYRESLTAERAFDEGCAPLGDGPPRFDEYFFWDSLHPTAAVHAAIGEALLAAYAGSAAVTATYGAAVAPARP